MANNPHVSLYRPDSLPAQYDVGIAAVGFEARARFVAENLHPDARIRLACAFPDRKVLSYQDNIDWYSRNGYKTEEVPDEPFGVWCGEVLRNIRQTGSGQLRIWVDISSLSRFRIAALVDTFRSFDATPVLHIDFLYSLAKSSPPPRGFVPNAHVGPVLPSFAGWPTDPDRPPAAIVGLGYEQDKALGAVEHIQASLVWLFKPLSSEAGYAEWQVDANKTLLEDVPRGRQLEYPVEQPLDCFVKLESLIYRLAQTENVVMFPFGPKIFALNCLLVGCLHTTAAVWRVSPGTAEEAVQRFPNGEICGLSVRFIREPTSEE